MAEFRYNNIKSASINHILFELKYSYPARVSFNEDTDRCSRLKTADKLLIKLEKLMTIY